MKTTAIIQARMNSTRLPGKVLLPIGNTNAIQMIVDKCESNKLIDNVVIATTPNSKEIYNYCLENKIDFYVGSEDDVLNRVYKTAKVFKADIIIDITADCPFIDLTDLELYLDPIKSKNKDYVSNIIDRQFPDGLDLQVYSFTAFSELMRGVFGAYRQHTGWNFTRFPNNFKLLNMPATLDLKHPDVRITLDTAEDYAVINLIYIWLGCNATPKQILHFLFTNPDIKNINSKIKAKQPGE